MHTLEIPDKQMALHVPDSWGEMSPGQRSYCLRQAILFKFGIITHNHYLISCFYKLAEIHRNWYTTAWEAWVGHDLVMRKNENIRIAAEQLVTMMKVSGDGNFELKYECELAPFHQVSVRSLKRLFTLKRPAVTLHGPDDLLGNITFGEFRIAIEEMNIYFETNEVAQLNRFVACLFRPIRKDLVQLKRSESFDGHIRQPFNQNMIDNNARLTARMEDWQKMAVLLWFTHCIKAIQAAELTIGDREVSLAQLFPKPAEGEEQPVDKSAAGWSGVLTSIAKEGLFGDVEKTDRTNLFSILLYMYDQDEANKRLERKYRSKKP